MEIGVIGNVEQIAQSTDYIQDIHESGRIIRKSLRRIELSRTYSENSVSPCGKAGNIITETVRGIGKDQPEKQCCTE